MSGVEDRISLAAIILSAAAFIIAVGQLLQQYYATAEGYRRCQDSVLGKPWARYTRRAWRWSEFRYETLFATPHIRIGAFLPQGKRGKILADDQRSIASPKRRFWTPRPRLRLNFPPREDGSCAETLLVDADCELVKGDGSGKEVDWAKVCWLDFLKDLSTIHKNLKQAMTADAGRHSFESSSETARDIVDSLPQGKENCLTFPTFVPVQQSWDFMPPDALKPLARIDVCDLVVCIRRLGMKWSQFRPHDGLVRAESKELVLTSTYLRSLGCCVTITRLSHVKEGAEMDFPKDKLLIPDFQADAMGFGLLPACGSSGFKDQFKIGTSDEVQATFARFDPSKNAVERLQELAQRGNFFYSFLDIIPLVAPFMRRRKSQVVRIPQPMERPSWIFISTTGRLALPYLLHEEIAELGRKRINVSSSLIELMSRCAKISNTFRCWTEAKDDDYHAAANNAQDLAFLEMVHDLYDHTRAYFDGLREPIGAGSDNNTEKSMRDDKSDIYADLVKVHLEQAILADSHAERILGSKEEKKRTYPKEMTGRRGWNYRMAETLAQYLHKLQYMRSEMVRRGHTDLHNEAAFLETWAHMMIRGLCWHHCHTMIRGMRVPSEYWNSRMPIYIG